MSGVYPRTSTGALSVLAFSGTVAVSERANIVMRAENVTREELPVYAGLVIDEIDREIEITRAGTVRASILREDRATWEEIRVHAQREPQYLSRVYVETPAYPVGNDPTTARILDRLQMGEHL